MWPILAVATYLELKHLFKSLVQVHWYNKTSWWMAVADIIDFI